MKKKVFVMMAAAAMIMTAEQASAWSWPGHLVKEGANLYRCDGNTGYCQKSIDPNDDSPSPGDRVVTNFPDLGELEGVITEVRIDHTDPNPPNDNQFGIYNGEYDIIVEVNSTN